jgi:cysteine-rich repeat protein
MLRHLAASFAVALAVAAAPRDAGALSIALEYSGPGSCAADGGGVNAAATAALTERGHTVTVVAGDQLDTLDELAAYDVVVFGAGGFDCGWDWLTFDAVIDDWVNDGGGLVVTGWAAYFMASNPRSETYPGLAAVLPVNAGTGFTTGGTVTPVAGHPITEGVNAFAVPEYNSHGAGVPSGATVLINHGTIASGAAHQVGAGRAVYLGPTYLANWDGYNNEALLDGTNADALRLFVQAVEWAAPPRCGNGVVDGDDACDGDGAGTAGETATCDVDCTAASCGDGTLNAAAGEACDDGNDEVGDDCVACAVSRCGDGVVQDQGSRTEACDGDGAGTPGETATCDVDCTVASCGDGALNAAAGEACDDGNTEVRDDCVACAVSRCGDGVVQDQGSRTEACDDGNDVDDDACGNDCTVNVDEEVCGDGELDASEECDEGAGNGTPETDCNADCTTRVIEGCCATGGGGAPAGPLVLGALVTGALVTRRRRRR